MADVKAPQINPLQTVKGSNVNQVSDKVTKILSEYKFGSNDNVKFRLLISKPNPDTRPGKPKVIYPNITIPTSFEIVDNGNPTLVAAVKQVIKEGEYRIQKYDVDGSKTENGIFRLVGNKPDDVRIFPLLMLSPYRKGSPFARPDIEPLYELVDEKAEKMLFTSKKNALKNAFDVIEAIEAAGELREYAVAFGANVDDDADTLKGVLDKEAMADPVGFVAKMDLPATKMKAIINIGIQKQKIQYDAQQHRYMWTGGETIATLNRVDGVDHMTQFCEWLLNSKNGEKAAQMIKQASK